MALDLDYRDGDRVLGSSGSYDTTSGAVAKALRMMAAWYTDIGGEGYGNRAHELMERGQNTPEDREELRRHYEDSLAPLVASGEIAELLVEAEGYRSEARLRVSFRDVAAGITQTLWQPVPWGIS